MKKIGLLHGELSKVIAEMGHGDTILIGDAGMPISKDVKIIDLALIRGVPSFKDVLEAVASEFEIEEYAIAEETGRVSSHIRDTISLIIGENIKYRELSHEQLKEMSKECKACIRTGEFTPYANIILRSGVVF